MSGDPLVFDFTGTSTPTTSCFCLVGLGVFELGNPFCFGSPFWLTCARLAGKFREAWRVGETGSRAWDLRLFVGDGREKASGSGDSLGVSTVIAILRFSVGVVAELEGLCSELGSTVVGVIDRRRVRPSVLSRKSGK